MAPRQAEGSQRRPFREHRRPFREHRRCPGSLALESSVPFGHLQASCSASVQTGTGPLCGLETQALCVVALGSPRGPRGCWPALWSLCQSSRSCWLRPCKSPRGQLGGRALHHTPTLHLPPSWQAGHPVGGASCWIREPTGHLGLVPAPSQPRHCCPLKGLADGAGTRSHSTLPSVPPKGRARATPAVLHAGE